MNHAGAAFPFSDEAGLCVVLRDPRLWADVFCYDAARKSLKRAAKRVFRLTVLRVSDELGLGEKCVDLLSTPRGREALTRERGKFASVGSLLLTEVARRYGEIFSEDAEFAVFDDGNWELDFERFEQWLKGREWTDGEIVALALFACGFAMQTPRLADELLALIADHEPRVQPLLLDELVEETGDEKEGTDGASEHAASDPAIENESEASVAATADEVPEATAPEQAACPALAEVESGDVAKHLSRQTVDEWRMSLAALKQRVSEEEARLALLDQTAEAVERAAAEVGQLPCFLQPLQFGEVVKINGKAEGSAELQRLTEVGLLLGQVLRSHRQLEVLMQRMSLPSERWLPGGHSDLQDLAVQLEERAAALNQQVELLNRTITRGMEFIDQIATADVATAMALVSEATPELWLSLARLLFDPAYETAATSARRVALGQPEIAGLILAQAWQREELSAITMAERLFASVSERWGLRDFATVLSPLSLGQMQMLANARPEWAHVVTTLVFLHAMRRDRAEFLDYIEPLLHIDLLDHACRDFFRAMSGARHRGKFSSLALEMRRALAGEPTAADSADAIERARLRVLEMARESPGMEGIYRRLRIFAQRLYLEPLIEAIERSDVRSVVSQWKSFGDLEDMANTAIRSSGEERKVDKPHREQTRRYLAHFADELQRWERMGCAAAEPRGAEFTPAVKALRDAKSEEARILLDAIESPPTEDFPPEDFGERGGPAGIQRVSMQNGARIRPTMLASWPLAPTGEVPLTALLADSLREHLMEGSIPLQHAIKAYVQSGFYDAARRAASGDASLQSFIEDELTGRRNALTLEHEQLWNEAQSARDFDQDVDDCMGEIEFMLDHDDFAKAAGLYDLLGELLVEFKRKSDPERQALCAFLAEGGAECSPAVGTAELEVQVRSMREANSERRQHLTALRDAAANPQAPAPLRTAWPAAAQRLDRPSLWPTPKRSTALAGALAKLLPWMCGKWQFRSGDSDPITAIVQRVIEWVPTQLPADLQTAESPSTCSAVVQLADLVAAYCPDAAVLRHIGEAPAPQPPAISSTSVTVPKLPARVSNAPAVAKQPIAAPISPTQKPGAQLRECMDIEERESEADFPMLREAGRNGDWKRVRRLAATLACSNRAQEDSVQQDLQALYGIGLLKTETNLNDALLQDTCVAVIASRRADYYAGAAITAELPTRAILLGLRTADASSSSVDQLGQALSAVGEAAPTADSFQWFAELLRKADNVIVAPEKGTSASAKLGRYLWEQFKNVAHNEEYRSRLLRVLFRNHQLEALRDLAELSPLKDLIHTCLRAFDAAESDPDARAAALQLSAALRGQAQRKPNTQPWILLFHGLESARVAADHAALHYELDSDFVNEEIDGSLSVELRIKPSLFDPPQRLSITIGNMSPLLIVEEALFTEKSVNVPLAASLAPTVGSECQLAYRIEGMTTTQRRPIDLRGTWHLHRGQTTIPLDESSISHAWPGATRNPVKRNWGFFGRKEEITRIENYIRAPARIGSVMVFGERRIGKTSVLKEIISTMPPERGRVCGAFCDLSGLQFTSDAGTIPDAFFQRLVTYLDLPTENGTIADALAKHRGHPVKVERLARNLTPSISLYGALETLVQKLEEESGGVISRIAFFIDEFDRFVEPLVRARRDEVNNFMWELRQVIQRSERISLILAGSGLQRLLKENYQDALFGSIDEVTLPRFSWEKDRDAITDTFLPDSVRGQLCRAEEVSRLAQYAAEICGGHPMFLALLGSSAAQMARGRFLTPGFLDRVVANVVQAEPGRLRLNVERKFFYQFVFESLGILDPREYALARGLFATLARVTTWEKAFAWFPVSRVIEVSGLLQYANNRQLLSALDRLGKADAILNDKSAGQVRISVPITAAAVREDEGTIRAEVEHVLQTLAE